jgi:hypothetical protein
VSTVDLVLFHVVLPQPTNVVELPVSMLTSK